MNLKFHQLDILSPHALESVEAFRLQFCLSETSLWASPEEAPGRPAEGYRGVELRFIERSPWVNQPPLSLEGYGICSLSYLCEDLDQLRAELYTRGVRLVFEEMNQNGGHRCGFLDDDGLLFKVEEDGSALGHVPEEEIRLEGKPLMHLHHVSILTHDLRRAQRFYERNLGLRTVFEFLRQEGGFVFLADAWFDHRIHPFLLEIIGPPHLEAREKALLSSRGACYDHVCYVSPQVGAAWRWALAHGAKPVTPPYRYEGTRMAWLQDAMGVDIEIMAPIPEYVLDYALYTGRPLNGRNKWRTAWALAAYVWQRRVRRKQSV